MLCEAIVFYASVYLLIRSVKDCFQGAYEEETEIEVELEKRPPHPWVEMLCPMEMHRGDKDTDTECSICLEPYTDTTRVRRLPCNHIFCHSCFQQWSQTTQNPRYPCPLCNTPILPTQIDYSSL